MTKPVNIATYLAAAMLTTYYFNDPEEALRRAKAAGKRPGRYFGGITLPSGKRAVISKYIFDIFSQSYFDTLAVASATHLS